MEGKNRRQQAIIKIIKDEHIDNQEQLLEKLAQEQITVAQATLSRDLKELKVVKVSDRQGGYCYTIMEPEKLPLSDSVHQETIERGYLSLEFSGAFGVMKTFPGHAQGTAYALDSLSIEQIAGTIAGDDTILIIPKDGIDKEELLSALKNRIPSL